MEYSFRTLNYLGSKLRLLDFIENNVLNITESGAGVCDLFAGSGCVSYKLSKSFSVFSCDIQWYSQVICNALINKYEITESFLIDFFHAIKTSYLNCLFASFAPLIELEENAIFNKEADTLTDILENGSVEVFCLEKNSSRLSQKLDTVRENLERTDCLNEKSLISRYYGGVYFSYRQAVQIDIILEVVNTIVPTDNKDLFLAALLSTASDIVDTVGKHFAQPIKARDSKGNIKNTVYNKAIKDKTINVFDLYEEWVIRYVKLPKSHYPCQSIQGDYLECLKTLPSKVKTIYADPPYTRDHYSRFYHVLETITLRDSPNLSKTLIHGNTHVSNGIYRANRHQSAFCIKSKAPEAFKSLFRFAAMSNRNVLLSYSPYDETKKTHPRVVTMQQLLEWSKEYFESVETISAGSFKHNKLNSSEHLLEASEEAELLIICKNKK